MPSQPVGAVFRQDEERADGQHGLVCAREVGVWWVAVCVEGDVACAKETAIAITSTRIGDGDPEEGFKVFLLFLFPFLDGLWIGEPAADCTLSLQLSELISVV